MDSEFYVSSLVSRTFTASLFSLSSPPISVGNRYSAFKGSAGAIVTKNVLNSFSSTVINAGAHPSFAGNPLKFMDCWFGVTYREDKPVVIQDFRKLIADGVYREDLYSDLT